MKIKLKQDLWGRRHELTLRIPETWNTKILHMAGDGKKVLSPDHYRKAIGVLSPLLKKAKEICILFDDLSRPTGTYEIIPYLIELFEKHKIRDEQVRFICALGTHAPLDNVSLRKKLGYEVLERFPVYNHNPYENCEYIGKTERGTPVMVNKEYLACDVRIGISTFLPHAFCGFSGGYKILMPGICHVDTITYHHGTLLRKYWDKAYGIGKYKGNPLLDDIKACGRMAQLHGIINVLVNSEAKNVDIYAGKPQEVYGLFQQKALSHYRTPFKRKAHIVLSNAYGKANEAVIALSFGELLLKDEGGFVVVFCDIEGGQVVHYLLGRFGKYVWGRLAPGERKKAQNLKKAFIFSSCKDLANEFWFGKRDDVLWCESIEEILSSLKHYYKGKKVDVAVVPDGTIQML